MAYRRARMRLPHPSGLCSSVQAGSACDLEWVARINSLVVALLVFALSVIPGRSWGAALVRDEPGA